MNGENEEILSVDVGKLIETLTDPVLKRYLFRSHITRLVNCIAIVSLIVWGVVLVYVY